MNLRILRAVLLTGAFVAAVAGGSVLAGRHSARLAAPRQPIPAGTRVPVLVELFTSEGCSSCPPADELLAHLAEEQPVEGAEVIALEEHVDYWNRLGWTDPYSSAAFTERQSQYSDAFGLESVYTPQMVIDGRTEFVGSDEARARETIAAAAQVKKAEVQITQARDASRAEALALAVRVTGAATREQADLFLAVTEDKLATSPSRGENAGHGWGHSAVTRLSVKLGEVKPGVGQFSTSLQIPAKWRRENLRIVAFVQERKSRRVLGAGDATLAKESAPPAAARSH